MSLRQTSRRIPRPEEMNSASEESNGKGLNSAGGERKIPNGTLGDWEDGGWVKDWNCMNNKM